MSSKYVFIYDKKNKGFTEPKAIIRDFITLTQDSVLGGEDTLSFQIPVHMLIQGSQDPIQPEDFVEFESKKYIIKRMSKSKGSDGLVFNVECEGLYTMLIDFYVDGDDTWMAGATLSAVLERILRNTPFTLGSCDDFGTWDIELKELNCLEAINEARSKWPKTAEIYFDGYRLHAKAMRGNDTGYQLHYNKNILEIEREVDTSSVVTRLVGLGSEGMTIEGLDASKIPEDYKHGVHIVDNKVSKKYIDSDTIGNYATPKMYYEDFSDYTDQLELLKAMQSYIANAHIPKVTYTVTFTEMARQNVPYSDIGVGDHVILNDPDFGVIKLRVAEINRDPLYIENSSVTLGERHKSLEDYLSDFDASQDFWDKFDPGDIDDKIDQAMKEVTEILNSGNNTVWVTDNDGIICADRSTLGPGNTIINTTKLIKMSNGAVGCSTDGGQTYKTAMSYNGVVAETIMGGYIHSSHISVGDESKFADGFSPTDVRKPVLTQFDLHKETTHTSIGNAEKELNILNNSVAQTNTAVNLVKKELQDNIDILSQDFSGLNGDMNTMLEMYKKVNDDLYGSSYFRWTSSGLHATDYDKPSHQMLLGAKGIGFSTDGGKIFNNAITASGIVASQVNIGTFGEDPFKGLTIRNGLGQETFAIDTNGNISLMGNINMNGGAINWQNVSKITYDALDPAMRDKFTWIDSGGVYTGTVQAKQLHLKDGHMQVTNNKGETTFGISSEGDVMVKGSIYLGKGSVLDWSELQKPTPEQIGAMSDAEFDDYKASMNRRLTRITEDGIYTGNIDAGKIVVTGPKIPANAVDIKPSDIGAASKDELKNVSNSVDDKISGANNYTDQWASNMNQTLNNLKKEMVTESNVTTITHNAIRTATIKANQIIGGELAGVKIYCDNHIVIGSKNSSGSPQIMFKPNDRYTSIVHKGNYLAMQSDNLAFWGGSGRIYFQSSWNDTWFSKSGSTTPGSGTYVSMHQVIAKINELCRKAGISQL